MRKQRPPPTWRSGKALITGVEGFALSRSHGRQKVWAKEDLVFLPAARLVPGEGSQGRLQPRHSWADPQGFTCALVNASLVVILLFCREDVMYGRTDYALHNTKSCAA